MSDRPLRRSYETGHTRKFLVIVDDTPECNRALYFAMRRAERSNGGLALLTIIPPEDPQAWSGVEERMKQEAQDAAHQRLDAAERYLKDYSNIAVEKYIREGTTSQVISTFIARDEDIAVLVLAASENAKGPGPLITALVTLSGHFPIPMTIVPGDLNNAEIDAMA